MNKFMKIIGAVAIINILARLFGFLREMVIGYQYGTSFVADSIITAYTIPNFIYLVVGGALTTAFISVVNNKNVDSKNFVRQTFTIILITITLLTCVIIILTDPILNLFFADLSPQEYQLSRNLFYWMMPSTILLVLSTWMSGVLNVESKFHLSSFALLLYKASFLVIAVAFTYIMGAEGYGVGALISSIIMINFLYMGIKKLRTYSFKPLFNIDGNSKDLWKIALPIMLGGASLQFYIIIQRIFAAGFSEGAIAAVNYASKLTQFPQAVMMTAVTTVIYPLLTKKVGNNDEKAIQDLYGKGMHYLSLLLIPSTIFAFFYSETLVKIIFEYGNFTSESTEYTTPILKIFTFTMFLLAANTYITRFYYAKGNSHIPLLFSLISVFGINITVIYLLKEELGATSIAWGTFISAFINLIMLVSYLHIKYNLKLMSSSGRGMKMLLMYLGLGATAWLSTYLTFEWKWLTFIFGITIFMLSFVSLMYFLKFDELHWIRRKLMKK